ncbi:cuticle protein 14-like [Parasteatoda tepidariorum]|uniref:cuticle protein 14-like n=1 Tax=Parasteatoda tepidariorum TaxID=114398 RepID=UPI00077F9678|nr:cuticle protein 14-like [Parasteatoda tepidariorum]
MKVLVLCTLIALCSSTPLYNYVNPNYPLLYNTGTSQQYNDRDGAGGYQFGYDEEHTSGGSFRKETGDVYGNKYGSYGLRDADGRYRVVNYVADSAGFRADIKSNEPGVAPKDPASTTINKPAVYASTVYHNPIAPVAQYPVVFQSPYVAPVSSYYKGSPYYKGTPFTRFTPSYIPASPKGSPYRRPGYFIYP